MKHRDPNAASVLLSPPKATSSSSNAPSSPAVPAAPAAALGTAVAGTASSAPEEELAAAAAAANTAAAAAVATTTGPSLLDVSVLVASGGWLDLASGKHLQEASGTLCRDCREYVGSHLRVDYSTPRVLWPLRTPGVLLFGRGGRGGGQTLGFGRNRGRDEGGGGGRGGVGLVARSKGKENAGGGGGVAGAGAGAGGDWSGSRGKWGWVIAPQQGGGDSCGKMASIPPLRVTMMTWERPLSDLARGRALPPGLQSLSFNCSFRYFDVDWVSFPPTLLNLSFPQNFNQVINSIAWPPCLQSLTFG